MFDWVERLLHSSPVGSLFFCSPITTHKIAVRGWELQKVSGEQFSYLHSMYGCAYSYHTCRQCKHSFSFFFLLPLYLLPGNPCLAEKRIVGYMFHSIYIGDWIARLSKQYWRCDEFIKLNHNWNLCKIKNIFYNQADRIEDGWNFILKEKLHKFDMIKLNFISIISTQLCAFHKLLMIFLLLFFFLKNTL